MPQKTRIRLIAGVLLALLGTEAIILAPWAFEMAFLVDLFGAGFFDVFVLGVILLWFSQAVAFVKSLWTHFLAFVQMKSPTDRLAVAWDCDFVLYVLHKAERKARHTLLWGATLGSFAAIVVMLIRKQ